jgi:hypothetical protein
MIWKIVVSGTALASKKWTTLFTTGEKLSYVTFLTPDSSLA